jgi:hypothetical protein
MEMETKKLNWGDGKGEEQSVPGSTGGFRESGKKPVERTEHKCKT